MEYLKNCPCMTLSNYNIVMELSKDVLIESTINIEIEI